MHQNEVYFTHFNWFLKNCIEITYTLFIDCMQFVCNSKYLIMIQKYIGHYGNKCVQPVCSYLLMNPILPYYRLYIGCLTGMTHLTELSAASCWIVHRPQHWPASCLGNFYCYSFGHMQYGGLYERGWTQLSLIIKSLLR